MAVSLFSHDVSDLCLGKPALRLLSLSATVADALTALKFSDDYFVSVWDCRLAKNGCGGGDVDGSADGGDFECCRCVGKLCMVDVICYLCRDENLLSPSAALCAPISEILPQIPGIVMHLEPSASLLDAIDLVLQGAQNLVVPIKAKLGSNSRRKQLKNPTNAIHGGREFCWLTQEDIIRYLLSSIGHFSPIAALSLDNLGIICTNALSINYHSPASSAIGAISRCIANQTSVAVVDADGILIGEISPFALARCDKAVAAAIMTLSSGDLMAYIDCGGPPEDLVKVVKARLKENNLEGMLQEFTNSPSSIGSPSFTSSSSDEEFSPSPSSRKYRRSSSYSARITRRSEAIVCHPRSSLIAVIIQAIAHRVNYVWVIEDDCSLIGIVTFLDMLKVFREHLETSE
ncbi:CBS domain-containing protein CBSX5-like [Cucurbita maxima]|uniref:CBS domain-containing protein CBSX5-like n=1 Tax=Cucurbita maxima TaxID=3661 RepID=A0A6J1IW58_CUCMA|nr:CBS domain-containing protein CBSX5-like [Cucurbita maxima]